MKLAEALALRSDAQKRLAQLSARAMTTARYQEGEPPPEDPAALLAEGRLVVAEIESLVRRINRTNAATEITLGQTITDAIARRDALKAHRKLVVEIADAASGRERPFGFDRSTRSELRYVTDLPVVELRREADQAAKDFRELDTRIQQANWTTELAE